MEKRDLLKDNLWKLMIHMSVPGIIAMVVVSFNSFISAVFVGQYIGAEALAGISLTLPLTIITTSMTALVAAGASSVLSRAIGAGKVEIQKAIFNNVFLMSVLASIVLLIPGYYFAEALVELMGGKGQVLEYGAEYYKLSMLGVFFTVFAVSTSGLIKAEGKIKAATIYTGLSVVMQILLNPLLIDVLSMGIKGAALANIASMAFFCILNLYHFISNKNTTIQVRFSLKLDRLIVKDVLSVGVAAMLMQSTNFIRQVFIFRSMSFYGSDEELAFLGATFRIFMFSIIPVFGFLQAMQPVVGVNYGARNFERSMEAVKVFRTGAILLLAMIWLPSLLFPQAVLSLLLPEVAFSSNTVFNFRLVMFSLPFTPLASTGITFFQSIGNGKLPGILSVGRQAVLFAPLILILPLFLSANGIYYSIALENVVFAIIVLAITSREFMKIRKNKVAEENNYELATAS